MQLVYGYDGFFLSPVTDQALSGDGLTPNDIFSAGVSLTNADFEIALDEARASYSENIGAPKIPSVSWDDVGGLADVKADILDTVQLPLEHPELFASNLKKRSGTRSSVCLHGCRTRKIRLMVHTNLFCFWVQVFSSTVRQARARPSSPKP
jgi:hypothetical protein